jgi:hypothetical protein
MDWIRENKVLSAILGFIAVGVAGLGYLLFYAWGSYSAARDEYLALGGQIAQIKSLSLAPTAPNLQAKKALVQEFSTNVNKLGGALFYLQPTVAPAKQAEFQTKLKGRVLEIKKIATEAKIALPAEFSFGFNEYLGTLPNSDTTATELSGYLDGIEAVVKLMIACKVRSIDLLDRTPLEMEKDLSKATSSQSKKGPAPRPGAARATTPVAAAISEKRQVSFVVTLDQGSLQNLMSRLANPVDMKVTPEADQSHFASLRLLRVENQIKEGPIRRNSAVSVGADQAEIKPLAVDKSKAGKEAPTGPVTLAPPPPAPVDSIPVIGQELLKAQMEIDLVKFLDAAKGITPQQNR